MARGKLVRHVSIAVVDSTGDGKADAVGYDTTGDGEIDSLDTTLDGRVDTAIGKVHGKLGKRLVTVDERQAELLATLKDKPGRPSWLNRHVDGICTCFPKCDAKPLEDASGKIVLDTKLIPRQRSDSIQRRLQAYVAARDTSDAASDQLCSDLQEISGVPKPLRLPFPAKQTVGIARTGSVRVFGAPEETGTAIASSKEPEPPSAHLKRSPYESIQDPLKQLSNDFRMLGDLVASSFVLLESAPLGKLEAAQVELSICENPPPPLQVHDE